MSHRFKKLCTAFLFVLSINTVFLAVTPKPARAQLGPAEKCSPLYFESILINDQSIQANTIPLIDVPDSNINVELNRAEKSTSTYVIKLWAGTWPVTPRVAITPAFTLAQSASESLTVDASSVTPEQSGGLYTTSMDLKLYEVDINGNERELCQIADINMNAFQPICDVIQVEQLRPMPQDDGTIRDEVCRFNVDEDLTSGCVETNATGIRPISIKAVGVRYSNGTEVPVGKMVDLSLFINGRGEFPTKRNIINGTATFTPLKITEHGVYEIQTSIDLIPLGGGCAGKKIEVGVGCTPSECDTSELPVVPVTPGTVTPSDPFELCKQASKTIPSNTQGLSQFAECEKCVVDPQNVKGVWTAVGCIKTEPQAIIQTVVKIGIGLGGGIALLMTLIGGFLLTTSQGDPKRTQEGKDMVTSSVIGIVFVLFSVVILQFIGVTVLRLPGFGGA